MTALYLRSPVTRPLHHKPWAAFGTLRGRPGYPALDFRVTQQFDDPDAYWSAIDKANGKRPRGHNATDVGCGRCGDPIVAMAAGVARRLKDNASAQQPGATDALGIRIDHGQGVITEVWHLNGWTVADRAKVKAGQQIGVLGNSGLGAVCHVHVELKVDGVRRDPEPHMFGAPLVIGAPDVAMPQEDPMQEFIPQAWTVGDAGAVVYDSPNGKPTGQRLVAGTAVTTIGEPLDDRSWRQILVSPQPGSRIAAYARRVDLDPLPRDQAFEDDAWELLLSRRPATSTDTRIARAITAARGTLQGAQATVNALES